MWALLSAKIEEVTSITTVEYAFLLAALEARLEPKKFSCTLCAKNYKEKVKYQKRKGKGCYDLNTKVYKLENILFRKCVGNFNVDISFLTESFVKYEQGILPFKGTLSEQPNKIIEIFNIIEMRRREKQPKEK